VWNIITHKLTVLNDDLKNLVKNNIDISEAIACEIEEYRLLEDIEIVKYLEFVLVEVEK